MTQPADAAAHAAEAGAAPIGGLGGWASVAAGGVDRGKHKDEDGGEAEAEAVGTKSDAPDGPPWRLVLQVWARTRRVNFYLFALAASLNALLLLLHPTLDEFVLLLLNLAPLLTLCGTPRPRTPRPPPAAELYRPLMLTCRRLRNRSRRCSPHVALRA